VDFDTVAAWTGLDSVFAKSANTNFVASARRCVINDAGLCAHRHRCGYFGIGGSWGGIIAFTPTPAALQDRFFPPGFAVESVPDRLLAEFRRNVVGL
jgi:hypothetical protein